MSRVKSGKVTHARHKKVLKAAKGYYGNRVRNFRTATQAVDKANQYATRDRKARKRNFRALWIQRINAAVRAVDESLTYSTFINGLRQGRDRGRPQGAGRSRGARARRLRRHRRQGEGRAGLIAGRNTRYAR